MCVISIEKKIPRINQLTVHQEPSHIFLSPSKHGTKNETEELWRKMMLIRHLIRNIIYNNKIQSNQNFPQKIVIIFS